MKIWQKINVYEDVHNALWDARKSCNKKLKGGKRLSRLSHQLWGHIYDDTTGESFVRLESMLAITFNKGTKE